MKLSGSIDVLGDTHGSLAPIIRWIDGNVENLIHVGDFGTTGVHDYNLLEKVGWELNQCSKYVFVVRGNHDCPKLFNNQFFGGQDGGIYLLSDGQILQWNDQNILVNGGGISLDRETSITGINYWEDEVFKYFVPDPTIKIDHLITHVSIGEVTGVRIEHPFVMNFAANDALLIPDLYKEQQTVKNFVDSLIDAGHPIKTWHYGHYHRVIKSAYKGIKCRGLTIDEIIPFCRNPFE